MAAKTLTVYPLHSAASALFWKSLADIKLETLRTATDPIVAVGRLAELSPAGSAARNGSAEGAAEADAAAAAYAAAGVELGYDAFRCGENQDVFRIPSTDIDEQSSSPFSNVDWVAVVRNAAAHLEQDRRGVPVVLWNANTLEEFRKADKNAMLARVGEALLETWRNANEAAGTPPSDALFTPGICVAFADLKDWQFYHWFAFPAVVPRTGALGLDGASERVNPNWAAIFVEVARSLRPGTRAFVADFQTSMGKESICSEDFSLEELSVKTSPVLSEMADAMLRDARGTSVLVYMNASQVDEAPLAPLRNILAAISSRGHSGVVQVVTMPVEPTHDSVANIKTFAVTLPEQPLTPDTAKTVGWEVGDDGKRPRPRVLNMAPVMDNRVLASSAAALNLSLMKWRLAPELDLERMRNTKCLLLGAGTLGCNVARGLLAWGVQRMTLVDQGRVSFSNPPRQSLFEYQDCTDGGRFKAERAAEKLREILPSVEAEGVVLSIPMPGHPASNVEATTKACSELAGLVESHDVIFLLTDSRESRWLPSLLASAYKKLCINAAMGFDTFLVMRHGVPAGDGESSCSAALGCYFCNDVVAPGDSSQDRSLDQQCTVTRPGLSGITSALAVELAAAVLQVGGCIISSTLAPSGQCTSLLLRRLLSCPYAPGRMPRNDNGVELAFRQHPDGALCTAEAEEDGSAAALGTPPHQLRGFMRTSTQIAVTGPAFAMCTACSPAVRRAYAERGTDFLLDVFNRPPSFLEELTGLSELKANADAAEVDWDSDDESMEEN